MTNESYDREKLSEKNAGYNSQLEYFFSSDEMTIINSCIDSNSQERDLYVCLKQSLSGRNAEKVMRILGFITLGG